MCFSVIVSDRRERESASSLEIVFIGRLKREEIFAGGHIRKEIWDACDDLFPRPYLLDTCVKVSCFKKGGKKVDELMRVDVSE